MTHREYQTVNDMGLFEAIHLALNAGWRVAGRAGTRVSVSDGANVALIELRGNRVWVTAVGRSDVSSLKRPLRLEKRTPAGR